MFVPRVLPREDREAVRELLGSGLSDYEIARRTGVGRATVQRWRRRGIPDDRQQIPTEIRPDNWDLSHREAYTYLLGLYLGDGYVGPFVRTFSLMIACDGSYPRLVRQCVDCVAVFAPREPAVQPVSGTNGVRVVSYWKAWPLFFPQHGPGSKPDRNIQAIFCRSCDQLGIRWSRSNWRNISISHRASVALLDEFVGPKR